MIQAIRSNPMVRNLAIGAVLAGAVAGGQNAKAATTNSQSEKPAQEQVMSVSAAQAISATALSGGLTAVKNGLLDQKIRKLSDNEEELQFNKQFQNDCYKKYGLSFTTLMYVNILSDQFLETTLDEFEKKELPILRDRVENNATKEEEDEYLTYLFVTSSLGKGIGIGDYYCDKLKESITNVKLLYEQGWQPIRERYMATAIQEGQGKPSAQICTNTMDKLESSIGDFTEKNHMDYKNKVAAYKTNLPNLAEDEANLAAFKLYYITRMVINTLIESDPMLNGNKNLEAAFIRYYDPNVKP